MPKYTEQELRKMARRVTEGLTSYDPVEKGLAQAVTLQTALKTGKSLVRTKIAIRNLAI